MTGRLSRGSLPLLAFFLAACSGDGARPPFDPADAAAQPFLGCAIVQPISVGATVNGSLTTGDCRFSADNSFIDYYEFQLATARAVTITLSSSQFDAFLILFNRESGQVVAWDDDGGDGTNSRLEITLQPGAYVIGANSFFPGETGSYQLSVN